MLENFPHQDLADEMVEIIGRIGTGRTPENIRELVYEKVATLTAQEPFYLMGVLEDDALSDYEKAGAFTALRTSYPGQPRYPKDYHRWLVANTHYNRVPN